MKITFRDKEFLWEEAKMRGDDILKKMGLNRESALLIKNGALATEKDWFTENDSIEVHTAISGG